MWYIKKISLLFLFMLPGIATAEPVENITVLECEAKYVFARDYDFVDKIWLNREVIYRDKVFTNLNTPTPIIKSITPEGNYLKLPPQAVEFQGRVISRALDSVFIYWGNDAGNKIWTAVIDVKRKKAVVNQVYEGITVIGGESIYFDCR